MSRDNTRSEKIGKQDITFDSLISDTEARIMEYEHKIKMLRKSLIFFKKQASSGIPFPIIEGPRQEKIS
jgi:hypothetical protein